MEVDVPDPYDLSRSLFMVTEPESDNPALIETVHAAVQGGVTHVVLRRPQETARNLFQVSQVLAASLREEERGALLVHERVDIALAAFAHGAHLTLNSLPGKPAKHLLGEDCLMGISVHDSKEAVAASLQFADYLLFGHVYETPSHPGEVGRGLAALRHVVDALEIPVIAIGGITVDRVDEVLAAGASGVAVIRAISGADDPESAARELRVVLDQADYPHLSQPKEGP